MAGKQPCMRCWMLRLALVFMLVVMLFMLKGLAGFLT